MSSDWQRALVTLAATVLTVVIIAVLYWARSIFIPVALAIFLAFVLYPPVAYLHRRGLGRTPAVVVMVGVVGLVAVGIGIGVTHQFIMLTDTFADQKEAIKSKVSTAKTWIVGDGNGFQVLRFTNAFKALHKDLMAESVRSK